MKIKPEKLKGLIIDIGNANVIFEIFKSIPEIKSRA
jgi:hypothetical protein